MAGKSLEVTGKKTQKRTLMTRQKILKVAAKIIAAGGVHTLRMTDVAREAKIPVPLLSYHYPTQDALYLELIQGALEQLKVYSLQVLEKHPNDPVKALRAYIRTPIEVASNDAVFRSIWMYFYHLSASSPKFAEANMLIRVVGRERILGLVSLIHEKQGNKKHQMNLTELAFCIQGIMTGFVIMAVTEPNANYELIADRAVKACMSLLEL